MRPDVGRLVVPSVPVYDREQGLLVGVVEPVAVDDAPVLSPGERQLVVVQVSHFPELEGVFVVVSVDVGLDVQFLDDLFLLDYHVVVLERESVDGLLDVLQQLLRDRCSRRGQRRGRGVIVGAGAARPHRAEGVRRRGGLWRPEPRERGSRGVGVHQRVGV